ncbi:cadmium resistance transporter [Stanieria cyanosphaera PCC 7437]|uniref:Cadmium resistance transporter n=1 Tax=Stanieria cyanosphaera (strain ATCC 29371 / PCC 7437) TaxID=111780 RepID=K9XRD5_STAC7|nr:cadmium resistance transporter [Stanieria cyanosphaera]AFZ35180.1 cadmium resistance transporter [Stanieria cyanosphaera PCC 7437]
MSWWVRTAVAGSTAFIATNIDDIIILMLFFSQTNRSFRRRHIVVGQYLGFVALVIASLPGFFGGLILPKPWIGLLGIVPIIIGITNLISSKKDEQEIQTVSDVHHLERSQSIFSKGIFKSLLVVIAPQTYQVAAVTFANGGDNIGIYVPLFARSHLADLGIILLTFFILIGVWCYIAYQLTRHPLIARALTKYGKRIVPFVLIGLGIFILLESGTYQLLPSFQFK